jgi:hypothetical protein
VDVGGEAVVPRRVPVPDEPKENKPLDVDVVVEADAVVGADTEAVGDVVMAPDEPVSICCLICISNDSDPPDDVVAVGVELVVAGALVHCVPVVDTDGVVEIEPRDEPYEPCEVRSEKLEVVGVVAAVVVGTHVGSLVKSSLTTPLPTAT